mgnify:CR=1 FL=1
MVRPTTLYVLALEHNCYYVGVTCYFRSRMQQHSNLRGSAWTRLHKVESICSQQSVNKSVAGFLEDAKVLELMSKYGINQVRGGTYYDVNLSRALKDEIARKLWHNAGRCMRCGSHNHFARRCNNRSISSSSN